MNAVSSTQVKARLGIFAAMVLCFAWGARAQGTPDSVTPRIVIDSLPKAVTVMKGSIKDTLKVVASIVPESATIQNQWFSKTDWTQTVNLPGVPVSGTPISGATSANFAIPAALDTGTYYYYCLVKVNSKIDPATGLLWTTLISTNTVKVTVTPRPKITVTAQPKDTTRVTKGAIKDTLKTAATVDPGFTLGYQWFGGKIETECVIDTVDGDIIRICTILHTVKTIDSATSPNFVIPADLDTGIYSYACMFTIKELGWQAYTENAEVIVTEPPNVSVASADREILPSNVGGTAAISPMAAPIAKLAAGPNPVAKQSGGVNFFRQGKIIESGTLYVYDATGSLVKKVAIKDKFAGSSGNRSVGAWDLRDSKGRPVPEGGYVVKGAVSTKDGKKEMVSLILGVK